MSLFLPSHSVPKHVVRYGFLILLATLIVCGCSTDSPTDPPITNGEVSGFSSEMPLAWFDLQLELTQSTPGFSPPVASRAFGYSGVALYQSMVLGMPMYKSLDAVISGMPPLPLLENDVYWPAVGNAALATITKLLWSNATTVMMTKVDSTSNVFNQQYRSETDSLTLLQSVTYGVQVAEAVFEWSKTDGGHEGFARNFPKDYVAPTGIGKWVPTPRRSGEPQSALQPYWGQNRPFVLQRGNPSLGNAPSDPPAYSEDPTSEFYKQGYEVYNTVKNLSEEQRTIALFWADDAGNTSTPPGHSISILNQCIREMKVNLEESTVQYLLMGISVADAFIACWERKYHYNLLRPITYIKNVIDPGWNSPIVTDPVVTPPFPEFPSGHSVQSGAAAVVLSHFYGVAFAFTDLTHTKRGFAPRQFLSFSASAEEAAISRLYGGIHYRAAVEQGLSQGKQIGNQVLMLKIKN